MTSDHLNLPAGARTRRWLRAAGALALLVAAHDSLAAGEGQLQLLLLGDQGRHGPAKRLAWIKPCLAAAGINAAYSESLDALQPANLARYDVLMPYADVAAASPQLERARIAYVESGHGFAAIHCASACFGNSRALVALMGGRFHSHQTAVFAPVIVDRDHPVMRGFAGCGCWDGTCVHGDRNEAGRTVLAVRVDNGAREPWTWVREQGTGRVFHTASGHDERAWLDHGFEELLVRGVGWSAVAGGEAILAAASAGAPGVRVPLQYEPRPMVQHDEKRSPYPEYQLPLPPAASLSYTHVPPGSSPELCASGPDACHQPNGMGLPAVAPPLVQSAWVLGPPSRPVRIVLGGVKGPISAAGAAFALEMPPLREALDDTAIGGIPTYVRHEWGNDAAPVQSATVKAIRAAEKQRTAPWTADELGKLP